MALGLGLVELRKLLVQMANGLVARLGGHPSALLGAREMERAGKQVGKEGRTQHRMIVDRRTGSWGEMERSFCAAWQLGQRSFECLDAAAETRAKRGRR